MIDLSNAVVAVTGASSGIGRATVRELARHGATVALIARRQEFLESAAAECQLEGAGDAIVLPADVGDEAQMAAVVDDLIARCGRIDAWINNAAVTQFGRFEDLPSSEFERVLRTNLFGYVHCARAVLPHFHARGRGLLVNVSSAVAYLSQPYTSAYVVSKAAIRAFSDGLRQELRHARGIQVCTVLPAATDTPLFQMGANHMGRTPQPVAPVYPAERVARAIVSLGRRPRREVTIGLPARAGIFLRPFAPGLMERMVARMVERHHFRDDRVPPAPGNLFHPIAAWNSVGGNWRREGP